MESVQNKQLIPTEMFINTLLFKSYVWKQTAISWLIYWIFNLLMN